MFTVWYVYWMIVETTYRRNNWLEGTSCGSNIRSKKINGRSYEQLHRHMATTYAFQIYKNTTDTCRHSLTECNLARDVWMLRDGDVVYPLLLVRQPTRNYGYLLCKIPTTKIVHPGSCHIVSDVVGKKKGDP